MSEPTTYEIVLRGRASTRILRPLIDDFTLTHTPDGNTQLIGDICDPSHFHGILAHLTSVNAEVISLAAHQTDGGQKVGHDHTDQLSTRSPSLATTNDEVR